VLPADEQDRLANEVIANKGLKRPVQALGAAVTW
jgi:hypothetical protein